MVRSSYILIIFLISVAPCFGQDSSTEDTLRWFPEGSYQLLIHADKQMIGGTDEDQLYIQVVDDLLSDLGLIEIPSLQGQYTSSTIALVKSVFLMENKFGVKKKEKKSESFIFDFGNEMYVYRYDALDALVTKAFKNGEITRTNVRLFKRPVYSYRSKEGGKEHFLYATATGELLIAKDRLSVRAMVSAGIGRSLGLLDERDFAELHTILPKSPIWYLITDQHDKTKALERKRAKGAEDEEIAQLQDQVDKAAKFIVGWIDMDDELILHEKAIFDNSEVAEGYYKKKDLEWTMSPFPDESELKSETTLDGSSIVVTTSFDLEKIRTWITKNSSEEQ